jgi:uncharacterized protein (TIRG00374 family)
MAVDSVAEAQDRDGRSFLPIPDVKAWRSIYSSRGDEPRMRRAADALLFVFGAAGLLIASLIASSDSIGELDAAADIASLLDWLDPFWRMAYAITAILVAALIVVAFATKRRALGITLVAAIALVVAVSEVVARLVEGEWADLESLFSAGEATFPPLRIAVATAVTAVARPDLARPMRRFGAAVVLVGTLAAIVIGESSLSGAMAAASVGVLVAAALFLALGSHAGFPPERRVRASLAELGLAVGALEASPVQTAGVATYETTDTAGRTLLVKVYGRDARDSQLVARVWRMMWYRDPGPQMATSRLRQVEHEALCTLAAGRAGVATQDVVAVGGVQSGDAVIVYEKAAGPTLAELPPDAVTDEVLEQAWTAIARLHSARIAHGRIEPAQLVPADSRMIIRDLAAARLAAPESDRAIDVAELLVSTALLVGPERALGAARTTIGDGALGSSLPYIQPAALTPALRDQVHDGGLKVNELRAQTAEALDTELTPIAELHRVTPKGILFVGLTAFAAWLIISQLADIGLSTIVDELQQASWQWLVLVLILAQLPLLSQALALTGAVPTNLPYAPTVALESGIKFVNLTVPSSAGRIAVNIRYLQKQGLSSTAAVAAGALDGVAGTIVEVLLLLLIIPFIHMDLQAEAGSDLSALTWIIIAFVIGAVAGVITLIVKRDWRLKVFHILREGLGSLKSVIVAPAKLVRLFGGNILTEFGWALTLAASAHAYGADLGIGQALVVNMCASIFASMMPVPGGIGVAEASLAAGMMAFGVPQSEAYAAALTHRLATFYLPPIWGWFSLRYLTRKGYL